MYITNSLQLQLNYLSIPKPNVTVHALVGFQDISVRVSGSNIKLKPFWMNEHQTEAEKEKLSDAHQL